VRIFTNGRRLQVSW